MYRRRSYRRTLKRRGRRLRQKATIPQMMRTTADILAAGAGGVAGYGASKLKNSQRVNKMMSKTKTKTVRKSTPTEGGGYNQWTQRKRITSLNKRLPLVKYMRRNEKSTEEKVVFRWNGVKSFDNHGYYWLSNFIDGERRYLPCYSYDLTSIVNSDGTNPILPAPLSQMYSIAGNVGFDPQLGLLQDGVNTTYNLQIERAPGSALSVNAPHNKSLMRWASVQANFWGCKNRATRFLVQLVRFTEDDVIPHHETGANANRSALFQSIIKPFCFNPIATAGSTQRKYMKVLRSEEFILQPTSTTETDQDPHVKTMRWYIKLNRLLDYATKGTYLSNNADLIDQADYIVNTGTQNDTKPKNKSRIFLMVYSTNYVADETQTNADTPSFDLSVRTCHIVQA